MSHRVAEGALFEQYRLYVFDRQAFKGTFEQETGHRTNVYLEGFEAAIFDTVVALQYGSFKRGSFKKEIESMNSIQTVEYFEKMKKVLDLLYEILNLLKNKPEEIPGDEIDRKRDEIINILNGIWEQFEINALLLPTEFRYPTQVHETE
jgi:hypothetical protein